MRFSKKVRNLGSVLLTGAELSAFKVARWDFYLRIQPLSTKFKFLVRLCFQNKHRSSKLFWRKDGSVSLQIILKIEKSGNMSGWYCPERKSGKYELFSSSRKHLTLMLVLRKDCSYSSKNYFRENSPLIPISQNSPFTPISTKKSSIIVHWRASHEKRHWSVTRHCLSILCCKYDWQNPHNN